jgi:hypothetical protein
MNITLSADRNLVEKARRYAKEHGTSLNQLIRDYLERLAGDISPEEAAREFELIATSMPGDSAGMGWTGREVAYEDPPGKLRGFGDG